VNTMEDAAPYDPSVDLSGQQQGRKILMIEDEQDLTHALVLHLQRSGYRVAASANGLSGLMVARDFRPDLVLLDLGLPRLHGFGLLRNLRQTRGLEDVPVIVMTGSADPQLETKAYELRVRYVIKKPFSLESLTAAIESCVAIT